MKKIFTLFFALITIVAFADPTIYTPELISPDDGEDGLPTLLVLDWEPVAGTIGIYYELELSDDPAFLNPIQVSTELTSYEFFELYFNTEYFWRVRAVDNTGTSDWSVVWTFTTQDVIELHRPKANADEQDPNVPLIWDKNEEVVGLTETEVQIDIVDTFDSELLEVFHISGTNTVPTENLFFGNTYYWRVRGIHSLDTMEWSEIRNFEVIDLFELKKPNNNATDQMPDQELKWDNIDGIISFIYHLDLDDNFDNPMIYKSTNYKNDADTLNFGTKYYWRVMAYHALDSTVWTDVRSFTIIDEVLLEAPENGETNIEVLPTFSWDPLSGILSYDLEIDKSPDFDIDPIVKSIPVENKNRAPVEYKLTNPSLDDNTQYYWRVRAVHQRDTSNYSDVWAFVVGSIGIDQPSFNQSDVTVFPNPAADKIFIELNSAQFSPVNVTLLDLLGQKLIEQRIDFSPGNVEHEIGVADLPEGIYMIRLQQENDILTRKLIIHR